MLTATPCTVMRGGTSRALFFDRRDLPGDTATRDRVLLAAMGSPDTRQIDGMGGAHPLTSKVAIVGPSEREDADVDYLFLQVFVDAARVSDSQNCGNILAAVGPWAIEQGLVPSHAPGTDVRIHMQNTHSVAIAHVLTPRGAVEYEGDMRIDGVPGSAAPVTIDFLDVAGSSCGALLPTGSPADLIDGLLVSCVDNGMPVVLLRASDVGKRGDESPASLESDPILTARIEKLRLEAGLRMNLGDVTTKTVPKMCLVSPPRSEGTIATRTFIPHRVHESIGVLGAVTVATACAIPGTVAATIVEEVKLPRAGDFVIEHPSGFFQVRVDIEMNGTHVVVRKAALVRTARKLMSGTLFTPSAAWSGA